LKKHEKVFAIAVEDFLLGNTSLFHLKLAMARYDHPKRRVEDEAGSRFLVAVHYFDAGFLTLNDLREKLSQLKQDRGIKHGKEIASC